MTGGDGANPEPDETWLPDHRWLVEIDDEVVGWAAATAASTRKCHAGAAETSVHIGEKHRGHGIVKHCCPSRSWQPMPPEVWTLQTSMLTQHCASPALHHAAGYRTVGVRERIARRDDV